jgi:hypothetical protein
MTRRPASVRQNEITRAIKAAKAAGEEVSKVEIDKDGKITVTIGKGTIVTSSPDTDSLDWDDAILPRRLHGTKS